MKSLCNKLLLGGIIAASLAAGQAHAALRLSDAFDGAWGDISNAHGASRGWVFDVISNPDGTRVLYIAGYLYDNDGKPLWVSATPALGEFEYSTTTDLYEYAGGTFNGAPTENPTRKVLGSATIEFASCGEATLSITPAADSGYQPISYTLNALQDVASPKGSSCTYKKKFTACPAGTTAGAAPRTCVLTGAITRDLTLTNDTTWELEGLVTVGGDNANSATVTIEPGTLITGSGNSADYLYVNPGSKLVANGTPYAPIVFTSPRDGHTGQTPAPGDWGGIVLSGNAPDNKCIAAPFDCRSEFDSTLRYGGDNPHDSSGSLRYVQSRYAGYIFTEGREVNAFTFQAVGDGTVLEHLQSYRGKDDGFEWFGGTVNAKYLVSYEGGDDGFDWDEGWSGKVQFAYVKWADESLALGNDNGFESSNQADNNDASPRAIPSWSNVTLIGNGSGGGNGLHLKEGTGGHLSNILVSGFNKSGKACLYVDHAATDALIGGPDLTLDHTWLNCTVAVADGSSGTTAGKAQALFDAGEGNETGDPGLSGFLPAAGSPLTSGGRLIDEDGFFTAAPYIGAFRDGNDDWTIGWTHFIQR
ncbi:hypothetical protein [Dokdonella ginsengisoli]|uniref:Uncharacterized protein n=1 Tax=Dokdonella ginsengisoli TaxID=363846 RepID=A0ABV9QPF9_9GAMM